MTLMLALPRFCLTVIALTFISVALRGMAESDRVLCDFGKGFSLANVRTNDAAATIGNRSDGIVLRVTTGHRQQWPGVTLLAPKEWNLAEFGHVLVPLRNGGSTEVTITCRVDNPSANGTEHCVSDSLALKPGASGLLKVELKRASSDTLGRKLFGMRGYPVASGGKGTVNPSNVTQLLLFVTKPASQHHFEVGTIRASGTDTPYRETIDACRAVAKGMYRTRLGEAKASRE